MYGRVVTSKGKRLEQAPYWLVHFTFLQTIKKTPVGAKQNKDMKTRNNKVKATSEIAELEAKLQAARAKKVEEEKAARLALIEKVNKLPSFLGVNTLKEVMEAIRSANKASGSKTTNRISDETKANVRAALTAGEKTLREIADGFGVSVPTVQAMKKDMGLVKARGTVTAPAAPAVTTENTAVTV